MEAKDCKFEQVRPDKVYMVWVEGTVPEPLICPTDDIAMEETKRQAKLNDGKKVYLLESMGYCLRSSQPVNWYPQ